ncbi:fibronectin type III domain-containing protein [Roseivirga sp. BDSF3-8]|uniref:fibronectin type III domain-containing protein n=1 Tax=Roseivirga sp. BDSF3-8 TaxID=3241598 RepID=UPI00353235C9
MGLGNLYAQTYEVNPGTVSYRITDDNIGTQLQVGTYYGAPGGAMAGFNSEEYEDLYLRRSGGQLVYNWLMNGRLLFPNNYDPNREYPMIVMLHGAGESGVQWPGRRIYSTDDPRYLNNDHNLYHGGRVHQNATKRDPSQSNSFDGFIFFPQNRGGWFANNNDIHAITFIEELIDMYPIDRLRIYVHGLSDGGQGVWRVLRRRPDLFAAALPMSGEVIQDYTTTDYRNTLHVPIWQFQGGTDPNPRESTSRQALQPYYDNGGTPIFQVYENLGHGVWNTAYNEPDFFPFMKRHSKLSIHPFYGRTEFCAADNWSTTIGISPGFEAYEWSRNNQTITNSNNNNLQVTQYGDYRVRIRLEGQWTEWSDPLPITERPLTDHADIVASGTTVLPGLDGSTSVTLSTEESYELYDWRIQASGGAVTNSSNASIQVSDTRRVSVSVREAGGCISNYGLPVYVVNNGPVDLPAPSDLITTPRNETAINIFWNDNSTTETGFEVWRSTSASGPWQFVKLIDANETAYVDRNLSSEQTYFYQVRGVYENGSSPYIGPESASPVADMNAPTAPTNLEIVMADVDRIGLRWDASTDNVGVAQYRIYRDGVQVGTTTATEFEMTGLPTETYYSFYVVAEDISGNLSAPSNYVEGATILVGLNYLLYAGGTWDVIADFQDWPALDQGIVNNFDISVRTKAWDQDDYFAFKFTGYIYIDEAANYTFRTRSDDGSNVIVDGNKVQDNDGLHGAGSWVAGNQVYLTQGPHSIEVNYFERTGGQRLDVQWQKNGGSWTNIPDEVLRSANYITPGAPPVPQGLQASTQSMTEINLTWNAPTPTVVVLGSSTAEGVGATAGNSWVELLDAHYSTTFSSHQVVNLAQGGFTTYHIMPDGNSVSGRPTPDTNRNITEALSLNPDFIIVNLPSNDVQQGYTNTETMNNLIAVKQAAAAQGVDVFFTTTQPRDIDVTSRDRLAEQAGLIKSTFGPFSIGIFNLLADSNNRIRPAYASGDGVHLNNAGHAVIYDQVKAKTDPYSGATAGFQIFRSTTSGGTYASIATTGAGTTSYIDSDLIPGRTYYYKLKSVSTSGDSDFSAMVSATTQADTEAPTVPQNLELLSKSYSTIGFRWDASTDNLAVKEYVINYTSGSSSTSGGRVEAGARTQETGSAVTTQTSYILEDMSPETTYTITVLARDAAGNESAPSAPLVVITNLAPPPLPVEFLSFTATLDGTDVLLKWQTATEQENDYFTVERSTDLETFTAVGRVDGAGDSNEVLSYSFTDGFVPQGSVYYRIKQTDFNGDFDYSRVVAVQNNALTETLAVNVFPNPTESGRIFITANTGNQGSEIMVEMMDIRGARLYQRAFSPSELVNRNIASDVNLTPGLYIFNVIQGDTRIQKKIIIR